MTDQLRNPTSTSTPTPAVSTPSAAPQRCAAGCGFFGNPKTANFCSKCFKDKQTKEPVSPDTATTPMASPALSAAPTASPASPAIDASLSQPLAALDLAEPTPAPAPVTLSTPEALTADIAEPQSLTPAPATFSSTTTITAADSTSSSSKKAKNRCQFCSKKVGLTYFACKCDDSAMFCVSHRYPHSHQCAFDHQRQQKDKLTKSNPLVTHDKLERI